MKRFKENKGLDLTAFAKEMQTYWQEHKIFEKSINTRPEDKTFVFFEGPPSANGMPGIHHVMGRTVKDLFNRYKTLQGYRVPRKAGWDTHGLPVELGVEKALGITKEDIGKKITIDEYNDACKTSVLKYTDVWERLTKEMGYWVDMNDPYITYKSKYMESVWWLLKQLYNKDLLYKGYTIQPYSPKAGTGLSTHELNMPGCYRDVSDNTMTAQFKTLKNTLPQNWQNLDADVYFLAWTTTPWTLPSNTALAVGPKIDYVLVKTYNPYTFQKQYVILAQPLLAKLFGKKFNLVDNDADFNAYNSKESKTIPYQIIEAFKGKDLVGIKYEQLLDYAQPYYDADKAFVVIPGDFVTTEDGTGIVHIAPTFGQDDAKVAKDAGVPPLLVLDEDGNPVPLVDLQGRFRPEMGELAGRYVKQEYYTDEEQKPNRSLDVDIIIKLKEENKAFNAEKHKHSYPHCWRTDKPVLYYPLDSWFIKVPKVRQRLIELNNTINWKPKSTGEGRFGNWLQNANDWNLSRSRYWGIPLPIWRTEDGKEELLIGSIEELKNEMQKSVAAGLMEKDIFADFEVGNMSDENYDKVDLHKHLVDQIILVSPSGKPMKREADLIDVWFDSGSMPYAQWHYPFENKELIDNNKFFPADFIAEGVDQTRGWFYTLHTIATMVFDSVAYKNVVSNGLVLDAKGQKMSKRLGNGVEPFAALEKYSADATRWYMIWNANPWDNLKFDVKGIEEVRRKFFGTLYNTYGFLSLYANVDGFTYEEDEVAYHNRPEIDRWILSELNTLVQQVTKFYEAYEPTRVARAIQKFVTDDLSNWYVRLSRRRFWKGEYGTDKISAYQTLYKTLVTVSKLMAPIAPFYADKLYLDLMNVGAQEDFESVHLSRFPEANIDEIDKDLERKMQKAQLISSLALSLRKKEKIKVRQPLQRLMVPVLSAQDRNDLEAVKDIVLAEINVKELALLDDASGVIVKSAKPNFKVLGPKYGKEMGKISAKVNQMTAEDIQKLEKDKQIEIDLGDKKVILTTAEIDVTAKEITGWTIAQQDDVLVALDINISDELKREGIARDLVNRIQNLRKDSGLKVNDRINLYIAQNETLQDAVDSMKNYIKSETLIDNIIWVEALNDEQTVDLEIDEIRSKMKIEKQ
jgi:isoleucyl-tRNA synthetase